MGDYELNPSNNYYKGFSNPINININISHKTSQAISEKHRKKDEFDDIDIKSDMNKKNESGKVMKIINVNKMNNYILNSKTNYANYKKVPHQKNEHNQTSSGKNDNIDIINSKNNLFLTEEFKPDENDIWFKTQYNNFDKIKDNEEFSLNEYIKKKYNNNSNIKNITMKQNRNLNKSKNKSQLNIYNTNDKIIYTKALPIDYNNEKKIKNLFILNKNPNNRTNLLYVIGQKDYKINLNNIKYSTKKEYKSIINKYSYDKILLAKYILSLEERQWYIELINITNILINKREKDQILVSNRFIRKSIKLYEQFKWLIESLSIYFYNIIFGSENHIYNFDDNKFDLPEKNKMKWLQGFKWEGIYSILREISPLPDGYIFFKKRGPIF